MDKYAQYPFFAFDPTPCHQLAQLQFDTFLMLNFFSLLRSGHMQRIKISSNELSGKYLVATGCVFSIYLLWQTECELDAMLVAAVFYALAVAMIVQSLRLRQLEFDEVFLYISRANKCRTIPLHRVTAVQWTSSRINHEYLWEIRFYNEADEEETIRLVPLQEGDCFEVFKEKVQQHNRQADISPAMLLFDWDY